MELTEAQRRALVWLHKRGSEGVIDRYGRLVAGGDVAKHIDASTWLRLVSLGLVRGVCKRLMMTGYADEMVVDWQLNDPRFNELVED